MSLDHLIFDTTDADTMAETHSVGAYVRSVDGTVVTHSDCTDKAKALFTFVDGDVTIGSDSIAKVAHGLETGDKIQLSTIGVLPAPLAAATDYWLIRVDADTVKLATTKANANAGTAIDITSAAGGGTHTLTPQENTHQALDVFLCNPIELTAEFDFVYDEDSVHTSGDPGSFGLSIRMDDVDGANGALLAGTEGDYQGYFTNAKGELHVRDNDVYDELLVIDTTLGTIKTDTTALLVELLAQGTTLDSILVDTGTIAGDTTSIDATLTALSKAEDSIHASGDQGVMSLAVRNDAGTPLAADGDYIPLTVNSAGALYISGTDDALSNGSIATAAETLDVANTAQNIIVAALADRKYVYVYNNDNRRMEIGAAGFSVGAGFPISPGSYMELRAGSAVDIEFNSPKINHKIRTMELS